MMTSDLDRKIEDEKEEEKGDEKGDEKEDEKEDDDVDAQIAVLHMIADDKRGIYGDWEELQFSTIYSLLHRPLYHHKSKLSLPPHV